MHALRKDKQDPYTSHRTKSYYHSQHNAHPYIKTDVSNNSRSLLEHSLTYRRCPSSGRIIVSLLLSKNEIDGERRILNRESYLHQRKQSITFQETPVMLVNFTNNQITTVVNFPQLDAPDLSYIREWRSKMADIMRLFPITKNVKQLLSHLIPESAHESLRNHTATDALLDAVCEHVARPLRRRIPVQPFQREYIFIRDYAEAVDTYIKRLGMEYEKDPEAFRDLFNQGLMLETARLHPFLPLKDREEYLLGLEYVEGRALAELQSKQKLNYPSYPSRGPSRATYYCEEHNRRAAHSTEDCVLRKQRQRTKEQEATKKITRSILSTKREVEETSTSYTTEPDFHASVNGFNVNVQINTGAKINCISEDLVQKLGLKSRAVTGKGFIMINTGGQRIN